MSEFEYVGQELDLFAAAHNWKSYWSKQIKPYLRGDILEVGAGIGSNTERLDPGGTARWVCLEPDPQHTAQLARKLNESNANRRYEIVCGTLSQMAGQQFDTIIYIDVLEHIEHDRDELQAAATLLRPGGCVVVLSPAHQSLYTPLDRGLGHFRRYNRSTIRHIAPAGLRLGRVWYLDSVGLLASLANRLFLHQSLPTRAQFAFWDGFIIPASRVLDRLFFYSIGKSIVATWQKAP